MIRTRRLVSSIVLAIALLSAGTTAWAAAPTDEVLHEVVNDTGGFYLPPDQCPKLPPGLWVTGGGSQVTTTDVVVRDDGSYFVTRDVKVSGTAHDGDGNQYTFYFAEFWSAKSPAGGAGAEFHIYNLFLLQSRASAAKNTYVLKSGFNWRWTFDGAIDPLAVRPLANLRKALTFGDPITDEFERRCDPMAVTSF